MNSRETLHFKRGIFKRRTFRETNDGTEISVFFQEKASRISMTVWRLVLKYNLN